MRTSFGHEDRRVWFIPFVNKRVGVRVKLRSPFLAVFKRSLKTHSYIQCFINIVFNYSSVRAP